MLIKFNDYKIDFSILFGFSALIGMVISYGPFYLFHLLFILFIFFRIFSNANIINFDVKIISIPLFLVLFTLLSLFWTDNLSYGLRNIFYILCGFFTIFLVVDYGNDVGNLKRIYKLFCIVMLINVFVGLCENMGLFRLPTSPFSPYSTLLGKEVLNINEFSYSQLDYLYTMPTGFSGNPNNFGFIVIISLPFIWFFIRSKILKIVSFVCIFYLIWVIESRGLLLGVIFFIISYLLFYLVSMRNKTYLLYMFLIVFLFVFVFLKQIQFNILSIYDDILSGIEMIKYGGIIEFDSTGIRSYIYSEGLSKLKENIFFGAGIGSMQYYLYTENLPIQSFHFFPLELLIDIGLFAFSIVFFSYIYLIIKLYKLFFITDSELIKKISISCFFSLTIYLLVSIVPSSTVYILPFWFVLGLSLATLRVAKYEKI